MLFNLESYMDLGNPWEDTYRYCTVCVTAYNIHSETHVEHAEAEVGKEVTVPGIL